ncbi:hypothetical protein DITRI_Ditri19aG0045400 [Diplodiscus trichospermus]
MQIEELGLDVEDIETMIMEKYDISKEYSLTEQEFVDAITDWLKMAKKDENDHVQGEKRGSPTPSGEEKNHEDRRSTLPAKKAISEMIRKWWIYIKAAFLITLGIAVIVLFTTPLVNSVVDFSKSAQIPSFFVSYVAIPIALSFRLALKAITSAKHKTDKAASQAISKIYGAVFMNNVVGLVIFLTIVYVRNISWGVSAEVAVVLIICTAMGLFATFTTKLQFWTCIPVILLYPMSLVLLRVLTNGFV